MGLTSEKINVLQQYNLFPLKSTIKYNETPVQDTLSNTCGLFVLYFLINRMHNYDMSFTTLLNEIFDDDVEVNEKRIKSFASEHFF